MMTQHSHVSHEIRSQPESWVKALGRLPDVSPVLARRGERVAVIGCGTSWFMAAAYAALRERSGAGETDAFAASLFPADRRYDRVLAISRSGTTTEVVRAIEASTAPVTALTAVPDSPVAAAADETVALEFADEQSVVQTVFATTALILLRGSLGEPLEPVVAQCRAVLDEVAPFAPDVEQAAQYTFLGHGWGYGIALEAALKMREAAQLWTEAYPQLEYRHGPIAIAEPGRAVWVFGEPVANLRADIAATGAAIVADGLDPIADLVRAQLLAVRRAEAQQLDPDRPRSLTRSVVLGEGSSGADVR
ncbi:MAG: SIS domain-containing protein [Jatrophihabitantaceae bacterium]